MIQKALDLLDGSVVQVRDLDTEHIRASGILSVNYFRTCASVGACWFLTDEVYSIMVCQNVVIVTVI